MASSKPLDINLDPDERTLRQFGFIALVAFGLLATCAYFEVWMFSFGLGALRVPVASALGAIALLSGLFSAAVPKANKPLFPANGHTFDRVVFVRRARNPVLRRVRAIGAAAPFVRYDPMQRSRRAASVLLVEPAPAAQRELLSPVSESSIHEASHSSDEKNIRPWRPRIARAS